MAKWLEAEVVVPDNDHENRKFFQEQAGGQLRLPHCKSCDMMHYPIRPMCPDCRSTDIDFKTVSGKGTIHSYFVLTEPIHPSFYPHRDAPIALIELDEQRGVSKGGDRTIQPAEFRALRLVGNILKADGSFEDVAQVAIGKRVQVKIVDLGDGFGLPQWTLSSEAPEGRVWQVPGG
jgi:uncharacterized OB-fold protein